MLTEYKSVYYLGVIPIKCNIQILVYKSIKDVSKGFSKVIYLILMKIFKLNYKILSLKNINTNAVKNVCN